MTTEGSEAPADEPFDGVAQYRDTRTRLLELGRSLNEEQGRMTVPATPDWSVKDAYSHLAGSAADLLAGNLEGITTDPWTEAQVLARRDRTLAEVLDEMESLGEAMDSVIESFGEAMDIRLFIDQWTHEQDIRGTLGVAGGADSPIVAEASPGMAEGWTRRVARAGVPPLVVELDGRVHAADGNDGDGDAAVRLVVDGYEAMRIGLGRRSRNQLAGLQWSGTDDPSPYFEFLVFFSIADRDVADVR
jgi:hypothetical protein